MEVQKITLFKPNLDLTKPITLTFALTATNKESGVYTTFADDKDILEVNTNSIVSGACESMLTELFPTFKTTNYLSLIEYIGKDILLSDGVEYGKVTKVTANQIEYSINIYSTAPIKYIDFSNNVTIFQYKRKTDIREITPPNFIAYEGIHEEPKIVSDIFIERGVSSGFDSFKRLKQIKSLQELIKYGDGYFNVTTKATDVITN